MLFYFAIALLSPFSSGSLTLDEAFEVATGNVDGTCDPYRKGTGNGLLEAMYEEMKSISANAMKELKNEPKAGSDDVRKLLQSFFGVNFGREGTKKEKALDIERVEKVKKWFGDVDYYFEHVEDQYNKIELYCDSTFMVYTPMDHKPALDDHGMPMVWNGQQVSVGEALKRGDPNNPNQPSGMLDPDKHWAYWIPSQKVYLPLEKRIFPKVFPSYPNRPNYPTYCADKSYLGWTPESVTGKPIVVLCPQSFKVNAPDKVNLDAQPVGKVLDKMSVKSLTWYHEMFHVAFPNVSPDAKKWIARKKAGRGKDKGKQVPVAAWPMRKDGWQSTDINTDGGIMCMYLGLYDASKPAATKDNLLAIKNPESYAWFGLTLYLTTEGPKHQDWSTGACRDHDLPPERVTVTIDKVVPRQAEPTPGPGVTIAQNDLVKFEGQQ